MAQYRIYVSDHEDRVLQRAARELRQRPQDVLHALVRQLSQRQSELSLEPRFERLEHQNDAIFRLLELVAGEVAFTSGATRFSTKNNDALTRQASAHELAMKRAVESFRGGETGFHGAPLDETPKPP